jgi:hypothetical protein
MLSVPSPLSFFLNIQMFKRNVILFSMVHLLLIRSAASTVNLLKKKKRKWIEIYERCIAK